MTRRAALCLTVLVPLAFLLTGCAALEHAHVTLYVERSESEPADNRKARTVGTKEGVSLTIDLGKP